MLIAVHHNALAEALRLRLAEANEPTPIIGSGSPKPMIGVGGSGLASSRAGSAVACAEYPKSKSPIRLPNDHYAESYPH